MTRVTIAALLLTLPSGCVKGALVTPAEDHHVQTRVVVDSCKADGYGAGQCTQEDLEAMADQACLIYAIVKGEGSEVCGE